MDNDNIRRSMREKKNRSNILRNNDEEFFPINVTHITYPGISENTKQDYCQENDT